MARFLAHPPWHDDHKMPLLINEVHPNQTSGSEWVEFLCDMDTADLAAYAIYDDLRKIYQFSNENCLDGLLVVEVSGLNNDKDSVTIKHDNGEIIDSFAYQTTEKGLSWARQADGSFVLSSPSRGTNNPQLAAPDTPTPTDSATPSTAATATASSATNPTAVTTSAADSDGQSANLTSLNNPSFQLPYQASDIQLKLDRSLVDASRGSRLVFLADALPDKSTVLSVIMTSCLLMLLAGYLLYVKIKRKQ